jgi:hypothetical protein
MQSGVLVALKYVADNGDEFLDNFYLRGARAIERGKTEAPYAWVIPRDQSRPLATENLVDLLMTQGLEVHVADEDLSWSEGGPDGDVERSAPEGSYIVRLDQPYRTLALVLLGVQQFPRDEDPPYDDTGWTLPFLHQVDAYRVDEPAIFSARMTLTGEPLGVEGELEGRGRNFYLVNNTTDDNFAVFRFRLRDVRMLAAEADFEAGGRSYAAGSYVIPREGNPEDLPDRLWRLMRSSYRASRWFTPGSRRRRMPAGGGWPSTGSGFPTRICRNRTWHRSIRRAWT